MSGATKTRQGAGQKPAPAPNTGLFKKGHDPRRHVHSAECGHRLYKFTPGDCSVGFFAAIATWVVSIGRKLHDAGRWQNYKGRRASK